MKTRLSVCFFAIVLFASCNKKEAARVRGSAVNKDTAQCGSEFIAEKPVKAGETGIILPIGTKICIPTDQSEIRVELPKGYTFCGSAIEPISNSVQLPIATYHCGCSGGGGFCQTFYGDGLGFGCLHGSCAGSCEGAFGYKGYSLNKVLKLPGTDNETKETFLSKPDVLEKIKLQAELFYKDRKLPDFDAVLNDRSLLNNYVYVREQIYGVTFYVLVSRDQTSKDDFTKVLNPLKASCDCNGTKACTLKTLSIATDKHGQNFKIYYCDGHCNDCELTVN